MAISAVRSSLPPIDRCRHCPRSEEHTSELQSQSNLVCRLLLEKKKTKTTTNVILIKLIMFTLRTVRHPRTRKIVVIDIHITLQHMVTSHVGMTLNRSNANSVSQ